MNVKAAGSTDTHGESSTHGDACQKFYSNYRKLMIDIQFAFNSSEIIQKLPKICSEKSLQSTLPTDS